MKLGIIGLPRAGKSTVFDALTKNIGGAEHKGEDRIAAIRVPDDRVDALSRMFKPQKTIYAQVEYFLPGIKKNRPGDSSRWTSVRDCDALLHVVRNHAAYGFEKPALAEDFIRLDQELILADMVVAENRLQIFDDYRIVLNDQYFFWHNEPREFNTSLFFRFILLKIRI